MAKESLSSFHELVLYSDESSLNYLKNEASEKAKSNPDVADDATSQNQMQKQVERGQAPKDVDRVDPPDSGCPKDHVNFKNGTSVCKDGTIHNKGHGIPNPSRKVWDWLHQNGWCMNGIKL